jgi:hypothetical protein
MDGRTQPRTTERELFLEALERSTPGERSAVLNHPPAANGKLYLRDQDVLLCYDVKAKPEK